MGNSNGGLWLFSHCGKEVLSLYAFKNVEIVVVALGRQGSILHGLFHCTVGLVGVGAVGKAALRYQRPHFGEEMREFLAAEIHHAKLLDAGGVNQVGELR